MTYALFEASSSQGRPYFLYQFVEGDQVWRFTNRAEPWTSLDTGGEILTWDPAAFAHGDVVQTSEIERGRLELTWPLSHPFARRFLAPMGTTPETLFSTLRRAGVRAKYQRLCRHAHYGRGCGLEIAAFWQTGTVSAVAGRGGTLTIPKAADHPGGWYRGGVLRFGSHLGFITGHTGAGLTLSRPMPELAAALATPEIDPNTGDTIPVLVDIAPGCDLRAATCAAKFDNLANFGVFPEIPGRNPLGGGSIV